MSKKKENVQFRIWWVEVDVDGCFMPKVGWYDTQTKTIEDTENLLNAASLKQSAIGMLELSIEDALIFSHRYKRLV